ncbi:hypothetical protein GIB67_032380, partial [Kingdonia uniflora]
QLIGGGGYRRGSDGGQWVSYPPGSDTFREFCKAKAVVGGKWGIYVEFASRQFRGPTIAEGEEYFYVLADLKVEKRDGGIDELISSEYFGGNVQSDLSESFLCYQSQLEYGFSLPLTNLAKGIMNTIGECPVQLNGNMWEVARLVQGIWLGIKEEKSELKKVNVELEKELARSRADALKDVKQLKASHAVVIGQLRVETKVNLDEMVEERDRLGYHLMLKVYSEEEVDAIKADIYAEVEDEEEAEVVRIVDGLDGISRQTVLDNQRDNVKLPEGGSEKAVREMSLRINDLESGLARERETYKALLSAQTELQGYVQKGNANLRECQHKLDTAFIREKVLEGEIKAKESLVKKKEELLKDFPAREELNVEIG